jgi:hypothetical protein
MAKLLQGRGRARASRHPSVRLAPSKSNVGGRVSRRVTGPTLRNILDISAVTLWRWRKKDGFPVAKSIHGRLYFSLDEVMAWLEQQPDAA